MSPVRLCHQQANDDDRERLSERDHNAYSSLQGTTTIGRSYLSTFVLLYSRAHRVNADISLYSTSTGK